MNLHMDEDAFKEIINATAAKMSLEAFQVEKDYYVSLLLQKLSEMAPDIVFKGGTSLSKCYDVIDRFSEDIDLTLRIDGPIGNAAKKQLKRDVLQAIETVGFEYLNDKRVPPLETRSRRDFNEYLAGFKQLFSGGTFMMQHIKVETNVTYRAFPCESLAVSNYITKFLQLEEEHDLIEQYELIPFTMQVQTIDRTFLDKLFAICDYYEDGVSHRYSRHIYDIHMIWSKGFVKRDALKELIPHIIADRQSGPKTYSSREGYPLLDRLNRIIDEDFYKKDFETNTLEFLSRETVYEEAIRSLNEIITSDFLPKTIDTSRESDPNR
ncbi:nucleotidyl transferase AbiEii/AbiGii toxin family protein [Exiguobacterium flavidum]|uniref:nucleotidyl transferase AbiEii/AbiGii toxin family protein n=1 Tax=Exiguobacterium flavidum TaxID=2184695 RepID=UPI00130086DE|nr:nucleotidyl transferase AbiEii/AbiGii toxin family protein [Exiguobacterium flavidum]